MCVAEGEKKGCPVVTELSFTELKAYRLYEGGWGGGRETITQARHGWREHHGSSLTIFLRMPIF